MLFRSAPAVFAAEAGVRWTERGGSVRYLVICVALLATALAPAALCLSSTHETTFRSDEIGISFIYPSVWGQAVVRDYRGTASYMDYGVDWQIEFTENPRPCRSYLLARSLSKSGNLRIVAYEGSIDTTDLDLLRQDIAVKPDRRVDGHSARVVDMYYEPSGEAWRVTSWFSEDQFFEFCEAADVRAFEGKAEDAGLKRGVTQMRQANPGDVRLIEFTRATGRLLDSFRSRK